MRVLVVCCPSTATLSFFLDRARSAPYWIHVRAPDSGPEQVTADRGVTAADDDSTFVVGQRWWRRLGWTTTHEPVGGVRRTPAIVVRSSYRSQARRRTVLVGLVGRQHSRLEAQGSRKAPGG